MIEFLLNNSKVTLQNTDPNTTVLKYLREYKKKTGTKEGCASGDCGACTVVIAQLNTQNQLEYSSINACITLISSLHAKQLITVDDLKNRELHPCQQAMVDTDGSQCGFCTPGFVMSLFALQKNTEQYDRHKTQQALAGNLCRCTGYRSIDSAAQQMMNSKAPDQFDNSQNNVIQQLADIKNKSNTLQLNDQNAVCYLPRSVDELANLLIDNPQSRLVAGGTDLVISITQHSERYQQLISTTQIPALNTVHIARHSIEIGAAVSLQQTQETLAPYFPDFSLLLERFASLQIRNQGTLAGNIANASPIGDSPPALMALDATLVLRKGQRKRNVKVADFFIDYRKTLLEEAEFIEKIVIAIPESLKDQSNDNTFFFKVHKISKRQDDDISAISAAYAITLDRQQNIIDAKLAYGGMAATAKRAIRTEAALINNPFTLHTFQQAAIKLTADFQPLSDYRASSEYRLLVAKNLLKKCFIEIESEIRKKREATLINDDGHRLIYPKAEKTRIFDYV